MITASSIGLQFGSRHLFKDVIPYILFANNPQDSTNLFERVGRFIEVPRRKIFESAGAYGQ